MTERQKFDATMKKILSVSKEELRRRIEEDSKRLREGAKRGPKPLTNKIAMLIFMLLALTCVAQTKPRVPTTASTSGGRYQLFSAPVAYDQADGNTASLPDVFLIDTQEGRVWKFQPTLLTPKSKNGNATMIQQQFVAVPISDSTFAK